MKRSWIGFFLLLVILAVSIGVTWSMTYIHEVVSQDLRQAAHYAGAGDWTNAHTYCDKAVQAWEKWAHFRACFADHSPVEEIDASLAELEVYLFAREEVVFMASCMETARKIDAVGEAHGLVWWNFL